MAELVGAFGTAHSPVLLTDVDDWRRLEPKADLPVRPELGDVEANWREQEARYERATQMVREAILACRPDVLVIVGSDQGENFGETGAPSIELFLGEVIAASAANRHQEDASQHRIEVPGAHALGTTLVRGLCDEGFDVAWSSRSTHEFGLGHAITWPLRFLGLTDSGIPVLPIVTNVWNPPNQPSVRRCVEFGAALRRLLDASELVERVALLASGGLSHLVVDEELDGRVLGALATGTREAWGRFTDEELYGAHDRYGLPTRLNGTAEIADWIIVGSCAATPADVIDYVPAYRTATGLGVGMGFAIWQLDH